jgi:uncharacterized protein YneF (UPF0154 family)
MNEIMMEISLYLVIAILLGYIFGWLITKALAEDKIKKNSLRVNNEKLNIVTQELIEYKSSNTDLVSENNKILLENREQKLKLHQLSKKLKERDLLIKTKNNTIEALNRKVAEEKSNLEQKIQKHESEIEAFVEERTKILENFKTLQL